MLAGPQPTHPPTHATRLPKLPNKKRRTVLCLSNVQVLFPACLLTARPACIASCACTKHRTIPAPTSPVFGHLQLQNGPRRPFPRPTCSPFKGLAQRGWPQTVLIRPVHPAFEPKRRPAPTTDPRPCLSHLLLRPLPSSRYPPAASVSVRPATHPLRDHHSSTHPSNNIQPFTHNSIPPPRPASPGHGRPAQGPNTARFCPRTLTAPMPAILCFFFNGLNK